MEFIKRSPSIKLQSADGRLIARIVPPAMPNPPAAILLGERLFIFRDKMGYRETPVYVAPLETMMIGPEGPAPAACLARGCGFMAIAGTHYCPAHTRQHHDADRAPSRAEVEAMVAADAAADEPPSRAEVEAMAAGPSPAPPAPPPPGRVVRK